MEWNEPVINELSSKEKRCWGPVVNKAIRSLEAMHCPSGQDCRPKSRQKLRNALNPVCDVLFMVDIARILREISNTTNGKLNILNTNETSAVSFATKELLRKVFKHGLSIAQRQRKILVFPVEGSEQWRMLEAQMNRWKSNVKSRGADGGQGVVKSLTEACLLSVDVDANELVSMLHNAGLISTDPSGKVTYFLPSRKMFNTFKTHVEAQVNECLDVTISRPFKVKTKFSVSTKEALNGLLLHVALFLEKFEQHKPKTAQGLKNALKPVTSVLYMGSPKVKLGSFREKKRKHGQQHTPKYSRKRKLPYCKRRTQSKEGEKISFKIKKHPKVVSVPLNNVLSKIGSCLKKKKVSTKKSKSMLRYRDHIKHLDDTGSFNAWRAMLTDICLKAQQQNRVLVFCDDGDDSMFRTKVFEWLRSNNTEFQNTKLLDEADTNEKLMETEPSDNASGNKSTNYAGYQMISNQSTSTPKALLPQETLSKLSSLATQTGQLSADMLISLLEKLGYCQIQGDGVSYLGVKNTDLGSCLKGIFEEPLQHLLASFQEGAVNINSGDQRSYRRSRKISHRSKAKRTRLSQ